MGMFASLFGKNGSDKADKMRQQALDAFGAVKTPALQDLQVQLDKYVLAGQLTPEEAEAQLLNSNAFQDITVDPALRGAQSAALQKLQEVGNEGGLTPIDKARLQDITDEQNTVAKGRLGAIRSNANERGIGGSGLELQDALLNEQAAADRASKQGTDVAASAQARALQAIMGAGSAAQSMEAQQYGEEAQKAAAQNAIDKFNAETMNATNLHNVDTKNAAEQANLEMAQRINDENTQTANQNKIYNAQQNQTVFGDNLQKAAGEAGIYTGWANDASKQSAAEKAGDVAITGGLINAGSKAIGTAIGGPVGGQAAPSIVPNNAMGTADEKNPNVVFESEGGIIPGDAKVPGDSKLNDTVPVAASPGELIVPRSAMSDEDEFEQFMAQFKPEAHKNKLSHQKPEIQAVANLHARLKKMEGGV